MVHLLRDNCESIFKYRLFYGTGLFDHISPECRCYHRDSSARKPSSIAGSLLRRCFKLGPYLFGPSSQPDQRWHTADLLMLALSSREHTNKILVSYRERGYISADRRSL